MMTNPVDKTYDALNEMVGAFEGTIADLKQQNADLVAALKNLVDWHSYDPNCIDNCPECMAYADAKEILAKAGG